MRVFISGHLDLTEQEFATHYVPDLQRHLAAGHSFVTGDAPGADTFAQKWLKERGANVTVFHMFTSPRFNADFATVGGFTSDKERDTAMTGASDTDVARVRPGKESSGTAKNLKRRQRV